MKTLLYKLFMLFLIFSFECNSHAQSSWFALESGTSANLNSVDFIDGGTGIVVGASGTVLKTTDGGGSWDLINTGYSNDFNAVRIIDNDRVVIAGDGGLILHSADGGTTWEVIQQSGQDYDIYGLDIDRASGHGIAGGSGNTLIWTNNFGQNWTYIEGGYMSNYYCACMANADFGAVAGSNSIFQPLIGYTMNGGQSFNGQSFYPTFGGTGYEGNARDCYFFDSDNGFFVGALWDGQGFITKEINWGTLFWDAIAFTHPVYGISFSGEYNGVVVGGNDSFNTMIAETNDGGLTWLYATIQGTGQTMKDVVLTENAGYAVGQNGEILQRDVMPGITEENSAGKITTQPNPALSFATIHISLQSSQQVEIVLYDLAGRALKNIFSGTLPAGSTSIDINIDNLSAGLCYLKLQGRDFSATEKLLVK